MPFGCPSVFNGVNTISVGVGGTFTTLSDALAYIATQTNLTLISSTGTFATVQYSDAIVGTTTQFLTDDVRAGDLLFVSNDNLSLGLPTHYYPIHDVTSETNLIIECGIAGASQASVAVNIYRPSKFIIHLLEGEFDTSNITFPNGYDITILGQGSATSFIGDGVLAPPKIMQYGFLTLDNINAFHGLLYGASSTTSFDSMAGIRLNNITIKQAPPILPGLTTSSQILLGMRCASLRVNNFTVDGHYDHGFQAYADLMDIENLTVHTNAKWENLLIQSFKYFCTKDKIFKNVTLNRSSDQTGAAAIGQLKMALNGIAATTMRKCDIVFENLIVINDNVNNASMFGVDIVGPSSGNGIQVDFKNAIIDSTGTSGEDIRATGTATTINISATKKRDGSPCTINSSSTAVFINRDSNSTVSIAYAANITPNASRARIINVGQLTGNITINAPTNPITGDTLTLNYTSDATPGRQITYNAAFKSSIVPVSTANSSASHSFIYDGANWVQSNGPLIWV